MGLGCMEDLYMDNGCQGNMRTRLESDGLHQVLGTGSVGRRVMSGNGNGTEDERGTDLSSTCAVSDTVGPSGSASRNLSPIDI